MHSLNLLWGRERDWKRGPLATTPMNKFRSWKERERMLLRAGDFIAHASWRKMQITKDKERDQYTTRKQHTGPRMRRGIEEESIRMSASLAVRHEPFIEEELAYLSEEKEGGIATLARDWGL